LMSFVKYDFFFNWLSYYFCDERHNIKSKSVVRVARQENMLSTKPKCQTEMEDCFKFQSHREVCRYDGKSTILKHIFLVGNKAEANLLQEILHIIKSHKCVAVWFCKTKVESPFPADFVKT
jgi:hypothetical protein